MKDDRGLKRSMQCANLASLGLSSLQVFDHIFIEASDNFLNDLEPTFLRSSSSHSKRLRSGPQTFISNPATAALEAALSVSDGVGDDDDDCSIDVEGINMLLWSTSSSCASSLSSNDDSTSSFASQKHSFFHPTEITVNNISAVTTSLARMQTFSKAA